MRAGAQCQRGTEIYESESAKTRKRFPWRYANGRSTAVKRSKDTNLRKQPRQSVADEQVLQS
jgi:hypothetical protein